MKKIVTLILIVLVVFTILGYKYYSNAINYVFNPDSSNRVILNIKQGESASAVADQLYGKGLIKSPSVFKLYIDQKGLQSQIKAGRIVVQENYALPEIVDALITGKSSEMAATILEGWTAQQIADYLASLNLTTADEFMECLKTCEFTGDHLPEGYLENSAFRPAY